MTKKTRKRHKRRRKQPDLFKSTTDLTKLTVTGLVGAGLISTVGANLKNLAKK